VKIVIDAYAWIEVFIGSEKGNNAKETIAKTNETWTPDVVLAEIARKYLREGADEKTILERLRTIEETSDITSIDKKIALASAKCYIELLENAKIKGLKTPSLFDAVVLATARLLKAKVITADEHFKGMPETLWID